jgi:hypothetical protein
LYILLNCETQPSIKKHIDNYLNLDPQRRQEKMGGLISMIKKLNSNEVSRNAYQNFISVVRESFSDSLVNINNLPFFSLIDKEKNADLSTSSLYTELPKSELTGLEEPELPPRPKN